MDLNAESVLDALNDFERKPSEIPPILEDYLLRIAQNGEIIFPWGKLKPLLKRKLEVVLDEFYETSPVEITVPVPNFETFNYDSLKKTIISAVEAFTSAPFTIQRICELITNPKKHYNRTDKYMRGIEKNVLVVSTIEPRLGQNDANANVNPIVNGMIGDSPHDDNDCFNGHENNENEPSNNLNTPANHVLLDNFANVFPSAACIPSPSNSNICITRDVDSLSQEIDTNFLPSTECVETEEVGFEPHISMDSDNSEESKDEQMDTTTEQIDDPAETCEISTTEVETQNEKEPDDPAESLDEPQLEELPEDSKPNEVVNDESEVSESETSATPTTEDDVSASDNIKNEADSTPEESSSTEIESKPEVLDNEIVLESESTQCQQDDTVSQSDDNVSIDDSEVSQSDEVVTETCEATSVEVEESVLVENATEEVSQSVEESSDSSGQSMELESSTDEPSV